MEFYQNLKELLKEGAKEGPKDYQQNVPRTNGVSVGSVLLFLHVLPGILTSRSLFELTVGH